MIRLSQANRRQHRLAWCDAIMVAAALEAECDKLYSEDFPQG